MWGAGIFYSTLCSLFVHFFFIFLIFILFCFPIFVVLFFPSIFVSFKIVRLRSFNSCLFLLLFLFSLIFLLLMLNFVGSKFDDLNTGNRFVSYVYINKVCVNYLPKRLNIFFLIFWHLYHILRINFGCVECDDALLWLVVCLTISAVSTENLSLLKGFSRFDSFLLLTIRFLSAIFYLRITHWNTQK